MSNLTVSNLAFDEFLKDEQNEWGSLAPFDKDNNKVNVRLGPGEPFPQHLNTPSLTSKRPPRLTRRGTNVRRTFNSFGLWRL